MQEVILLAGVVAALAALAAVASRWTWGSATITGRVALGVIPGIIGAVIIAVWQVDLIPDQLEAALLPIGLGLGSFAMGALVLAELQAR